MYVNGIMICPIVEYNVRNLGQGVHLPDYTRNYVIFNQNRVNSILEQAEHALPVVDEFLKTAQDERQITEGLYVLDRMIDNKVQGADKLYPTISRFNDTNSPNIQAMLAGIYRKTLVPDAFGPLNKMLLRQTFYPNSPFFDPTEEIGGAILEYFRSASAVNAYSSQSRYEPDHPRVFSNFLSKRLIANLCHFA